MKVKKLVLLSALALLLAAPSAHADWFVSPVIGVNFEGDTNNDSRKPPFGVSFGYMGGGVVGFEGSLMYTPSFFGDQDLIGDNNVFSFMGNLIVGVPLGGERQVRPYVSGGVGLLRQRIGGDADDLFDVNNDDFGFNVGGGLMGFFHPNVGLRGDVRYYRSFEDRDDAEFGGIDFGFGAGQFDFWQATVGVAFRF